MVNGIGKGSSDAFDAIRAAMDRQAEARRRLADVEANLRGTPEAKSPESFAADLDTSIGGLDAELRKSDELIKGVVSGEVSDFHEIAAQVKQADLSFKFALAVRNKFIDAYREVMRMSV